jgi:hypothetical protein
LPSLFTVHKNVAFCNWKDYLYSLMSAIVLTYCNCVFQYVHWIFGEYLYLEKKYTIWQDIYFIYLWTGIYLCTLLYHFKSLLRKNVLIVTVQKRLCIFLISVDISLFGSLWIRCIMLIIWTTYCILHTTSSNMLIIWTTYFILHTTYSNMLVIWTSYQIFLRYELYCPDKT